MWLIIIATIAIYVRVGIYIYSHLRRLREVGVASDWVEEANRTVDTTTTRDHDTIAAPSGQEQAESLGNHVPSQTSSNRIRREHRRSSSDSNMAVWAYARYSFLFFIALLVTWVKTQLPQQIPYFLTFIQIPSSANRLATLINPHDVSFGLNYAAAFVIPLQGFWNSIIYATISRREFKAMFKTAREASIARCVKHTR